MAVLWAVSVGAYSQTDSVFYYYHNQRQTLYQYESIVCCILAPNTSVLDINDEMERLNLHISSQYVFHNSCIVVESKDSQPVSDSIMHLFLSHPDIACGGRLLEKEGSYLFASDEFIVKLKQTTSETMLDSFAFQNGCFVQSLLPYTKDEYLVRNPASTGVNTMDMSNYFYESSLFDYAHPNFVYLNAQQSNDPYYFQQWGLRNVDPDGNSAGVDIKVEAAWAVTKGSPNIRISVIDRFFDTSHPDLAPNLIPYSYDVTDSGVVGTNYHGTACAGIVAAKEDNNIGISGVAPHCIIIPTSTLNLSGAESSASIGAAIRRAYQHNADVISFSWGNSCSENHIESAICEAVSDGRDGKGCVVVCPSGNENRSKLSFPANLTATVVISVGGVDRCGARSGKLRNVPWSCDPWPLIGLAGSSYGEGLCVVAPGTNVLTTDPVGEAGNNHSNSISDHPDKDYTYFTGTSAASPVVAGVAALMLSVNPNMSPYIIRKIICRTAQKINYQNHYFYTVNKAYGLWNEELGYGLVDAGACVREASKVDLYIRDTLSDNGVEPSAVTYMWNSPDIWIEDLNGQSVDNPQGGGRYNVCVKIRNNDVNPSSGTQKLLLNWAKAGVNLPWPSGWDGSTMYSYNGQSVALGGVIGDTNGVTVPSCSKYYPSTVKIPWDVPVAEDYDFGIFQEKGEQWHFCLLARVHDGNNIVGEYEHDFPIDRFVLENNNVAWKNITVMRDQNNAFVWLANRKPDWHNYDFDIVLHKNNGEESLLDIGELYVRLNSSLISDWEKGGSLCSGLKYIGNNYFRVLAETASINNVGMPPGEFGWIETVVKFYTNMNPEDNLFSFDVIMRDEEEIYGGEHYEVLYDKNRTFRAIVPDDKLVLPMEEVLLNAGDVGEPAIYVWYDREGDTVAIGTYLSTNATQNQRYILVVESTVDGYKSCDSVNVVLRNGIIVSLSPNPAMSHVSVTYRLATTVTGGMVQIANMMGMVVKSVPLDIFSTSVSIDIGDLIHGQYTVKMVSSNGDVLDQKILVIQ